MAFFKHKFLLTIFLLLALLGVVTGIYFSLDGKNRTIDLVLLGIIICTFFAISHYYILQILKKYLDSFFKASPSPPVVEKKSSSLYEQGSSSKMTVSDQQQIHHFFQKLTPSSYPNISIPNALSNSILSMQSHDLIEKLRTDHIQTLSQPIVTLPQRRLAYLKCDSFFKENEILFSPDFSDLPSDLKYSLSMGRFYKTLQSISQQQDKFDHQTFIIPLSSDLITNRYTFEDIFALISQNKILSQSVILKIKLPTTQKDIDELLPPLFRIERQGMRLGLQLSHFQLQTYSQQNLSYFQFIELSLKDILSWQAETTRRHVLDILELFCQTVPKTILTDIDHPQILYELFPLTFDYGCGKAFGSYRDLKMLASR